jgi:hypothetical protein
MYPIFTDILSSSINKPLIQWFSNVDLILLLKKYVTSVHSTNTATLYILISADISLISNDALKRIVFEMYFGIDLVYLF